MRILVVEDERSLARAIVKILEKGYYSADSVGNGADALEYLDCGNYDAVILDVMMPVMDGITALKKIRERGNGIPVLVLTAKSEVDDKVRGLDSGADDYLTKPFDAKELLAAIRAITRPSVGAGARLTLGNLTLDRTTYELSAPGGSFRLTGKEFQVMELLMSDPSRVHRQERIFGRVWGLDSDSEINVVWVYMSYLRKKLAALGANVTIRLNRGVGYVIEVDDRNDKKD